MRRLAIFCSLALLLWGCYSTWAAYLFVANAERITGTVVAVEALTGPPKPRQKIPIHVEFDLKGATIRTETRMPLLGAVHQGDQVPLWVNPSDPQDSRLAQPSSLFAAPLTYVVCGLIGAVLSLAYSSKSPPTSPMSTRPPAESSST